MATSRTPGASLFFRDYADPILAKFRFIKKGRTYRRRSDTGDTALVNFQSSSGSNPESYEFYVNLAVAPVLWAEWLTKAPVDPATFVPTDAEGLYWDRLGSGTFLSTWTIQSVETGHACGRRLAETLPTRLDDLVSMLDRGEFLRRVRDGERHMRSSLAAEIILQLEQGSFDELERLLAMMDERPGTGSVFAEWARTWIRTHRTS